MGMQLTANNGLATPVNWKQGERVIVGPKVATEDAKAKFKDFQQEELPSGKPYLRSVAGRAARRGSPTRFHVILFSRTLSRQCCYASPPSSRRACPSSCCVAATTALLF